MRKNVLRFPPLRVVKEYTSVLLDQINSFAKATNTGLAVIVDDYVLKLNPAREIDATRCKRMENNAIKDFSFVIEQ